MITKADKKKIVKKKYGYLIDNQKRRARKSAIKSGKQKNKVNEMSSCGDKIKYDTLEIAIERMKGLIERSHSKMDAYQCMFCKSFHIGRK